MSTTPAKILRAVYSDLAPWCTERNGTCVVARSPTDVVDVLSHTPKGWRALFYWQGDEPVSDSPRPSPVVIHHFMVLIDGDVGPTNVPNAGLFAPTHARDKPFLDLLHDLRQRMLAYRFLFLRPPNDRFVYDGCSDQVPIHGMFIAAYMMRFRLLSTLDVEVDPVTLQV